VIPRSYLFVPGDRPERFEKAWAAGADCVLLDLEDAVRPEAKGEARAAVRSWLAGGGRGALRVNPGDTEWHKGDLDLLELPNVLAVMLPKSENPANLEQLASAGSGVPLIPLIETANGLLDARALASVPGVQRLAFGSVDFQLDTGIEGEGDALLFARSQLVVASAAAGIAGPVDGVTQALDDAERLRQDVATARELGFTGKLCIHPRQVQAVNDGFSPSADEVAWARRVVTAAEGAGARGALRLDGKLIDRAVVERAKRVLDLVVTGDE
jgi:citrate lyase subunit beta / citryl-CoA lyase